LRVSTEHGLDQEFNSLDAQYDAASAYIKSQAHAGWALIRSRYDDGGYSGGSTERPDLQRLLDDIRRLSWANGGGLQGRLPFRDREPRRRTLGDRKNGSLELSAQNKGVEMAKKAAKKSAKTTAKKRIPVGYTKADVRELRAHSKARTPVRKIAKEMKRSEGSLRQKALALGIGLGHRR
jgi:hypothetical protein